MTDTTQGLVEGFKPFAVVGSYPPLTWPDGRLRGSQDFLVIPTQPFPNFHDAREALAELAVRNARLIGGSELTVKWTPESLANGRWDGKLILNIDTTPTGIALASIRTAIGKPVVAANLREADYEWVRKGSMGREQGLPSVNWLKTYGRTNDSLRTYPAIPTIVPAETTTEIPKSEQPRRKRVKRPKKILA